jgi:hypothetical protein
LDKALQTNHRCPGDWGFFVTRASAAVQPPPVVPEDPSSNPQRLEVRRRGCRGGHGRGGQQSSQPRRHPDQEQSSPIVLFEGDWPPFHVDESELSFHAPTTDLQGVEPEIPTLIVPTAFRTSRPADCESPASAPRLSIISQNDDIVARPHTAPPVEIPCRHTFIHYSSEPTPTGRRQRSRSTPALPLPNREWDLDFARQTANVPLSRCVTPKPESNVDARLGAATAPELPAAPALPAVLQHTSSCDSLLDSAPVAPESPVESTPEAKFSLTMAPPGTPSKTPPRKSSQLQPASSPESPVRSSPWKSTHRGSRGGQKTRRKKAGPAPDVF